jgi:hypothetical protein
MGPDLELLTGFLVHMRAAKDTVLIDYRRQGYRPRHPGAGPFCRIHDLADRLIKELVVISF